MRGRGGEPLFGDKRGADFINPLLGIGVRRKNIRVNALVPGPIDTDFRHFMRDEVRREFEASVVSRLALHRQGTAAEAAEVALFLLSDAASFVSGGQYAVDGGLTLR